MEKELTKAARYERNEARQGYRSGHYDRNLTTTSGDVTFHMPRLKGVTFETAIIERYHRRESSVEEAPIEMCLAGVSVRRVKDTTEALRGSKVSPSTISELNKIQGETGGQNAQGDPRPGEQEYVEGEGAGSRYRTENNEIAGGCQEG